MIAYITSNILRPKLRKYLKQVKKNLKQKKKNYCKTLTFNNFNKTNIFSVTAKINKDD